MVMFSKKTFNVTLSENFVGFVSEDVIEFDVNLGVVGTDDQPEIVFEGQAMLMYSFEKEKIMRLAGNY